MALGSRAGLSRSFGSPGDSPGFVSFDAEAPICSNVAGCFRSDASQEPGSQAARCRKRHNLGKPRFGRFVHAAYVRSIGFTKHVALAVDMWHARLAGPPKGGDSHSPRPEPYIWVVHVSRLCKSILRNRGCNRVQKLCCGVIIRATGKRALTQAQANQGQQGQSRIHRSLSQKARRARAQLKPSQS